MPQPNQIASDFPIPTPDPVQYTPPQQDQQQGMTAPPQRASGWEGKGGQMANIASNFMHGWIAGRNIHREREMKQEVNEVSMQRQQYQNNMEVYHNRLTAGADPKSPEMQELGKTVASAYRDYMVTMGKYSGFHDEAGTGDVKQKKQGAGAKAGRGIKNAVMGPPLPALIGQQLYQHSMQQAIKGTQTGDISWLPGANLTGADKAEQMKLEQEKHEIEQQKQQDQLKTEIKTGIKDAIQDPKKMDEMEKQWPAIRAEAKIMGLPDPGELPKPGEEAFDAQVQRFKQQTIGDLMSGKLKISELNDFQRFVALGVAPPQAPWQFYERFVPASVKDPAAREKAAHQAFINDEINIRRAGRDPNMAEMIRYNIDQAHKGEPGWTEKDTAKEFVRLTTGNKGKTPVDRMRSEERQSAINGVYTSIANTHPELGQYITIDPMKSKGNQLMYGISQDAPAEVRKQLTSMVLAQAVADQYTTDDIRKLFPEVIPDMPQVPNVDFNIPAPMTAAPQTNPFRQ